MGGPGTRNVVTVEQVTSRCQAIGHEGPQVFQAEMTRVGVWEFLEGWLNQDLCHGTKYLLFNSQAGATWPAPKIFFIPKFSDLLRLQVFSLPPSRCSMGLCLCRDPSSTEMMERSLT